MKFLYFTFPDTNTQKYRPHVFCGVTMSDISQHMMSAHRHEQTIIDIALLNKNERIAAVAQLKRYGIIQSNATILAGGGPSSNLVCARKSVGEKVICSRDARDRFENHSITGTLRIAVRHQLSPALSQSTCLMCEVQRTRSSQELFFIENIHDLELAMHKMCSEEKGMGRGVKCTSMGSFVSML